MKQILVLQGLPASGKSTIAKQWVAEDPENRMRVNLDDLRAMSGAKCDKKFESVYKRMQECCIMSCISKGKSLVIDNTNFKIDKNWIQQFIDICKENYEVEFRLVNTPLHECIKRDAKREKPVGEDIIRNFFERNKNKFDLLE